MTNDGSLVVKSAEAPNGVVVREANVVALATQGRAEAREVRFVRDVSAGEEVALIFSEPFPCAAVLGRMEIEKIGVDEDGLAPVDRLIVCFVPGGAATSVEEQRRIDRWIESAPVGVRPVIDLLIRGDRIRWRAGRCVIHGAVDRFSEILQAVTSFAFYEGRLRRLESELQSLWPTAERDTALTRRLNARSLDRWKHVDSMTEDTTRRRIEFARIEPHLEKPPLALSVIAQRAIAELAVQADVEDRLVYVDDRLEVFEDLYGRANEKLSEYSYFRREHRVELAIVAVLLLQMTIDLFIKLR